MDFVGGWSVSSRGRDFLFMVEDRFNKLGVFIPCKKVIKGHEAVKLFFAYVWIHFGLISSTMSDRASRIMASFG